MMMMTMMMTMTMRSVQKLLKSSFLNLFLKNLPVMTKKKPQKKPSTSASNQ